LRRELAAFEEIDMRRIVLLAVIGLGLGLTAPARADLAPPLPPNKESVAIKIEVDEKAKGPRLLLPHGAFVPGRVRPGPKGELPRESEDGIAENERQGRPDSHIVIAGVAVALSLAFGGMWLVRRNGKGSVSGLALLIATAAMLTIGAVVWANGAPPPIRKDPAKVPNYPVALEAKTSVEFFYGQEPIRLILDKESFEKLKKGELKQPPAAPK
jgi:hypothetical protein